MQIVTTHKNADFDAFASWLPLRCFFRKPGRPAKTLNPNVKAFLSIHKDLFETHTPGES